VKRTAVGVLAIAVATSAMIGCGSAAKDAHIEAFSFARQGQLDRAAEAAGRCRESGDDEDRYLCNATLGAIRARQSSWAAAADAYGEAFAVRDRIAMQRHYGAPPADDLFLWGTALARTKRWAEAERVLERARNVAEQEPDDRLHVAAIDLALARLAAQRGEQARAATLRGEASVAACATDEVAYYGDERTLHQRWFPDDVWLDLGATCQQPHASALLRSHATASVAGTQ